jgi:hypothetical protein
VGIPASALDLLTNNQILGGIVSSACFAAISGMYILCVRRMRNADLKALIPSSGSNVVVVCPGQATRKGRGQAGLMTAEAMALAEVLQCAGALNKIPSVQSCAEKTRHSGVISLGGINNSFTAENLSEFCRGLEIKSGQGASKYTLISHGITQITPPGRVQVYRTARGSDRDTRCAPKPLTVVFRRPSVSPRVANNPLRCIRPRLACSL